MNASKQAARSALDDRKARRRLRWRVADVALATPVPAPTAAPAIVVDEVLSDPEDVVAAIAGCLERAEGFVSAGRSFEAFACLDEAADLFVSLDDYESSALAGNARRAARLDEVLSSLVEAIEDYRR